MNKVHELKTHPEYFQAARDKAKRFELRKNDRDFQVGDILKLMEWDPEASCYTGRSDYYRITYILTGGVFGLPDDLCVLSI